MSSSLNCPPKTTPFSGTKIVLQYEGEGAAITKKTDQIMAKYSIAARHTIREVIDMKHLLLTIFHGYKHTAQGRLTESEVNYNEN